MGPPITSATSLRAACADALGQDDPAALAAIIAPLVN